MKRILLIAYFYPPLGGPGVQRPVKLVKYLRKFGWLTDVITVKDIVFHSYDEVLAKEDEAYKVYRISSLDPMSSLKKVTKKSSANAKKVYFNTPEKFKKIVRNSFPIDEKIGWFPAAYKAGKRLLKTQKYDAVMATIGPYTSAIIAYYLSKRFHIPLLIDYRDHWSLNPYLKSRTRLNKILSKKWESKILKHATTVSTIGETMRNELIDSYGSYLESKIIVMYNGFDESDFENIEIKINNKIIFRYIGNFYGLRSPKYFIKALENLKKNDILPVDIQVEFIGNYYPESRKYLTENKVSDFISIRDQVDHKEALELLMNSDAVLLFITSLAGEGILTGKMFEYIRSGKPILAMIPKDGEAGYILKEMEQNNICAMEDVEAIEKSFLNVYNIVKNRAAFETKDPGKFSRENQTKQFVEFVEQKL
ncbi:glycosyltransferase [Candidatus Cloacimonadota bacterium]